MKPEPDSNVGGYLITENHNLMQVPTPLSPVSYNIINIRVTLKDFTSYRVYFLSSFQKPTL